MTDFAVISGLSGAGRTTAADVLEDRGWFVIDNMPVSLMPKVVELAASPGSDIPKVAFVVGSGSDFAELLGLLDRLRNDGCRVRMVFLDANSETLIRRFESTRRRHPASAGELLGAAIGQERHQLDVMRAAADVLVDTSDLNVHQLRERIAELFNDDDAETGMQIMVTSFGFKHGLPPDVDMVFDCRFLPNPHWVDELRPKTGLDPAVSEYVVETEAAQAFLAELDRLYDVLLPGFQSEGKSYLTIAFGCTGGRHRSVAMAEESARRLRERSLDPGITHRDVTKDG